MAGRARIKFLGRHLMLKGLFTEKILSGEKRATIRKGIYKPRYEEIIIHAGGRPIAKARITRVYYKRLKEIGNYEAKIDGYENTEELIKDLRMVYGDIRENDYLTIIEFEVIQRLDFLPVEDKYHGLKPSDIARIALRYIANDLDELDKKILLDLTRTNSIRKTAINVFNDLDKRRVVRRTLRKTLRLLIEKGLIRLNTTSSNQEHEESMGNNNGLLDS